MQRHRLQQCRLDPPYRQNHLSSGFPSMALTNEQITTAVTQIHEWFSRNSTLDPKSTVRNSIAVAQRAILSNSISVEDHDELLAIVIDELFPMDHNRADIVRRAAAEVWQAANNRN